MKCCNDVCCVCVGGEMFRSALGKTLGFVGYTIQYGCVAHCAFEYIGEFVACSGPSMEPTITSHDVVFSERLSRHLCRIENGDIVIAKSPFDPHMNICKRVIGLEGDKVCTSGPSDVFKTHQYVLSSHIDDEAMDKLACHLLGVFSTVCLLHCHNKDI
uniref:mitochondrial inner membrane protease subunit 1-like isoform X2 n=1 Tax=Oncorhynchus gorbuscha TaxID=8017 RepID=UPI001EAF2801|nr:mitochondrial inner membrane protease subunit 1-like isoform X2 [Oncorhynchus gorbuscha]